MADVTTALILLVAVLAVDTALLVVIAILLMSLLRRTAAPTDPRLRP